MNADSEQSETPQWAKASPFDEKVTSTSGTAKLKLDADASISVKTRAELYQAVKTLIEQGYALKGWMKDRNGVWGLAFKRSGFVHL